jgi:hypothetical protein
MTRDEARKAAAVMLAYAEGKPIQYKLIGSSPWEDTAGSQLAFDWSSCCYRIKPEVVRYKRVLYKPETRNGLVAICYSEGAINTWMNHECFIRVIDTEWQEEEV